MGWRQAEETYAIPPMLIAGYIAAISMAIALPRALLTDPAAATSTLERAGYSAIEVTGYSAFGCRAADEDWRTAFSARSPEDAKVTGVVCQSTTRRGSIMVETTSDPALTPLTAPPVTTR